MIWHARLKLRTYVLSKYAIGINDVAMGTPDPKKRKIAGRKNGTFLKSYFKYDDLSDYPDYIPYLTNGCVGWGKSTLSDTCKTVFAKLFAHFLFLEEHNAYHGSICSWANHKCSQITGMNKEIFIYMRGGIVLVGLDDLEALREVHNFAKDNPKSLRNTALKKEIKIKLNSAAATAIQEKSVDEKVDKFIEAFFKC